MPSPFPGMNPYLEQPDTWEDFHQRFLTRIADAIAGHAPTSYVVKLKTHISLDEEKSAFIEIRDRERRALITVVEMLSPTNKYSGPDREGFLAKRHYLLNGPVNYVELDLMRGGPRMPIAELKECDYYALVRRTIDRIVAGLWPLSLRDPMPTIPIPLRSPDADVMLPLQEIFHTVYDAARYENYIYDSSPQPPLSAADAAWAKPFLPVK